MEITNNVLVCVNLMDEAKKRILLLILMKSQRLGVPVVGFPQEIKGHEQALKALSSLFDEDKRN